MMNSKIHPEIQEYLNIIDTEPYRICNDQKLLAALVRKAFATEDIYTDAEQFEKYLSLVKYFPFDRLFPWEKFIIGLHDCTYWTETHRPRWPELLCLVNRGSGKDGFMAYEAMCLTSPYHGIPKYDCDICANNETQALRPVRDLVEVLDAPENIKKLQRFFEWTSTRVIGAQTGAKVQGWTNAPKGKDGMRTGKAFFNEIHQYENYDNIDVFTTSLGKKPHPRKGYYSTQGTVRDGPLDDIVEDAERILQGSEPDNGMLPFMCRLDSDNEVHDELNWPKAGPSLPYLPDLMDETRQEYRIWAKNPSRLPAFMPKRMNRPATAQEYPVASYDAIKATNKPIPNLTGKNCVVGIDYASIQDWAAVDFHFKIGNARFDINHAWICTQSPTIGRIKPNWRKWVEMDLATAVDAVEIPLNLIINYIREMGERYNIKMLALDNFRYALLRSGLEQIGFTAPERGGETKKRGSPKAGRKLKLVRPSDIMQAVPVIDSCFTNGYFAWGDNPMLRWAAQNTKKMPCGKKAGFDTGNFVYAKIEAKARKTDPFMAVTAAMTVEHMLAGGTAVSMPDIPTATF